MKKQLLLLFIIGAFFLTSEKTSAQLADGSIAPDWTLTDLNGETWNLYSVLNSGKTVYIDFSATWCGPCWNYHNTHALEDVYEMYGPNGTDEAMVFFIEGDGSTNLDCVYGLDGCNASTYGDWTSGVSYPIFNPDEATANQVTGDYNIGYYPTVYAICSDKRVYETGQLDAASLASYMGSCALDLEITAEGTNCGEPNGYAEAYPVEGTPPFSFSWSNGGTGSDADELAAGFHNCTITDNNGISITQEFFVEDSEGFEVEILEENNISCYGENDGSISLESTGLSGVFNYIWSNGAQGSTIDNLEPGEYEVTISEEFESCSQTLTFEISEPAQIVAEGDVYNASCGQSNGAFEVFAYGGDEEFTYDIGFGAQYSSYFSDLAAGLYTLTVTDGNGCYTDYLFEIEDSDGPTASIVDSNGVEPNELNCAVQSITLDASQSDSYPDNNWTKDGEFFSSDAVITVTEPGEYVYTVNDNTCTNSASTTVTMIENQPMAEAGVDQTLTCLNTSVTVQGSGAIVGYSYEAVWTDEDDNIITDGLNATFDNPGTYTLSITATDYGCVSTDQVTISADQSAPAFGLESSGVLNCNNDNVTLTASEVDDASYSWMMGDESLGDENVVTVNTPGVYNLTVTDNGNGCTTTQEITVEQDVAAPQVSAGEDMTLMCSGSAMISGSTDVAMENVTALWTTEDGTITGSNNGLELMISSGGTYTLTVTNSANGCTTSDEVVVTEDFNDPVSNYSVSTNSLEVTFTAMADGDNITYAWDFGDGNTSTEANPTHTYGNEGEYNVCLTVSNECGSNTKCTMTSVSQAAFSVSSSVTDVSCHGGADGSIDLAVTSALQAESFTWSTGATTEDLTEVAAGDYSVTIVATDGSEYTFNYSVSQPDAISAEASVSSVSCNGESDGNIVVTGSGGTGDLVYSWDNDFTGNTLDGLAAGNYNLTVTDANGCQSTFGPYEVTEPEALMLEIAETTSDSEYAIEAMVSGGTAPYTYLWSDGATTASRERLADGEYTVTVTDANGCIITSEIIVVMTSVEDLGVGNFNMYPNPVNDVLNLRYSTSERVSFKLFNQLGQEVLSIANNTQRIDLNKVATGTYFLQISTENGSHIEKIVKL